MRKLIAVLLALVMICGLFGCKKEQNVTTHKPATRPYSLADMLLTQAASMAQKIGMSADTAYLNAMGASAEMIEVAESFRLAATAEPTAARILNTSDPDFSRVIIASTAQTCDTVKLACSGLLSFKTQIFMTITLKQPMVVYLQYSDTCHFVSVFTPQSNNIISVWTYPLFAESAEKILEDHLTAAQSWNTDAIRRSLAAAENVRDTSSTTNATTDRNYYTKLASAVLRRAREVRAADIAEYTDNKSVVSQVAALCQRLSDAIQSVSVYRLPESLQTTVSDMLCQSAYQEQLLDLTRQRVYLSWLAAYRNTFGRDWVATDACLQAVLPTTNLGACARQDEEPVLLLINLGDDICVLMSVYPNAYNNYTYSLVTIPKPAKGVQGWIEAAGATRIQ